MELEFKSALETYKEKKRPCSRNCIAVEERRKEVKELTMAWKSHENKLPKLRIVLYAVKLSKTT